MTIIRMLLSVLVAKNSKLHKVDIHHVSLHGDLDEEVYVKLPLGFTVRKLGKVYHFQKSLDGLRQAHPRCWFPKPTCVFFNYGFKLSYFDY